MSDCKHCEGKGWLLWIYPARKPKPVYWFSRGPNGERPHVCRECETIEQEAGA